MTWLQLVWTALSAVLGGFIGGWCVAYRLGQWRATVEMRLKATEERLERGDVPIGQVPILGARLDVVISELREIKGELREDLARMVSREECDRRHEN